MDEFQRLVMKQNTVSLYHPCIVASFWININTNNSKMTGKIGIETTNGVKIKLNVYYNLR